MPISFQNWLVIGISSRALFDLAVENAIYDTQGLAAYREYQIANEGTVLRPGAALPLVRGILSLNSQIPDRRKAEVVVMSRNSPETSLRIFNSIEHYGLDITRAALSGGAPLAPYLEAFKVDLFLSMDESDVRAALRSKVAAAIVYDRPEHPVEDIDQIRIAFDGDAVLFSSESERLYQEQGLAAFLAYEKENARKPLPEGPFAKLLRTLAYLQGDVDRKPKPVRMALVTARNGPAVERAIRTLRAWGVDIDEAFFLGGLPKAAILKAFRPHMFFDDQASHCEPASKLVPTGRVPGPE